MNGKKAKALRAATKSRTAYQRLKRDTVKQAIASSQNPIALPVRTHKRKPAIKPTWPHTDDQHTQSRPLICVHPVRQFSRNMLARNPANPETGQRSFTDAQRYEIGWAMSLPKHMADALACQ